MNDLLNMAAEMGDRFKNGLQAGHVESLDAAWPEQIAGAAVVVERVVLPPEAEEGLAERPDAAALAREHPEARDMRIVVAVTRSGETMCALRLRGADDESVLTGPDLVPGLADALAATFR